MTDHAPLDERHRTFLEMLARDDDFRAAFEANPGQALVNAGLIGHVPEALPNEAPPISKEDAECALEENRYPETLGFVQFFANDFACPGPGNPGPPDPKPPKPPKPPQY